MRGRVYKTYMAVTTGAVYPIDEMISFPSTMPRVHELIMELSQAVGKTSKSGKQLIDKKPDGASSPNLADGAIMAACPERRPLQGQGFLEYYQGQNGAGNTAA
jgi:hypothetical protein